MTPGRLAVVLFSIVLCVPRLAWAGAACNQVIAAQEKAAGQIATAAANGTSAAMGNLQTNQGQQQNTSSGCFSSLSHFGGSSQYPTMSGLLSSLESMACSMGTGVVMGAVSSVTSPILSSASNYGLGGNVGFGQSGMTTQPSGPPPIIQSSASSVLGAAGGGASSVFGTMGSSMSNKVQSVPGANMSTLPGTNKASGSINNSFNNIYKP